MDIAEIRKKAKKKKEEKKEEGKEKEIPETGVETPAEEPQVEKAEKQEEQEEKSLIELAAETLLGQGALRERIQIDHNLNEFLGIKINEDEYGLSIENVTEIIKVPQITDVPLTPDYVLGVIYLRGRVITLISLRKKLGFPEKNMDRKTRVIIVNNSEEEIGLLVDEVTQVFRIPADKIEPPPVNQKENESVFVSGIARYEGVFLRILNINEITKIEYSLKKEKANG